MDKLVKNSLVLQSYFAEIFTEHYPKEIIELIIMLQLQLYYLVRGLHHQFSIHNGKIYVHTKKDNLESIKQMLSHDVNNTMIVFTKFNKNYHAYSNTNRLLSMAFFLDNVKDLVYEYNQQGAKIQFSKKSLKQNLQKLTKNYQTVFLYKLKDNLLFLTHVYSSDFHLYAMTKILK